MKVFGKIKTTGNSWHLKQFLFLHSLYSVFIFLFSSNHDGVPEEAIELFDKVDNLLEGTSVDHELAFKLLDGYKNEVYSIVLK